MDNFELLYAYYEENGTKEACEVSWSLSSLYFLVLSPSLTWKQKTLVLMFDVYFLGSQGCC
jgi:hypothetical protein